MCILFVYTYASLRLRVATGVRVYIALYTGLTMLDLWILVLDNCGFGLVEKPIDPLGNLLVSL